MKCAAIIIRILYLVLMVIFAAIGQYGVLAASLPAFFVALPVFWMGTHNKKYYFVDLGIMLLFAINASLFFYDGWDPTIPHFGYDKILHFLAGVCVAGFFSVFFEKHLKHKALHAMTVLAYVTAMAGAWELFEYLLDHLPGAWRVFSSGYADSMQDMVAVIFGAILFVGTHMIFQISQQYHTKGLHKPRKE